VGGWVGRCVGVMVCACVCIKVYKMQIYVKIQVGRGEIVIVSTLISAVPLARSWQMRQKVVSSALLRDVCVVGSGVCYPSRRSKPNLPALPKRGRARRWWVEASKNTPAAKPSNGGF